MESKEQIFNTKEQLVANIKDWIKLIMRYLN